MALRVAEFKDLRDDATVQVVGEYYRQGLVRQVRTPVQGDLPEGVAAPAPGRYKALLTPQPTNQYDRNAILVALWAGAAWSHAGFLSRADALRYQPLFRHIGRDTPQAPGVTCDAALIDERDGVGVVLHLGTPGECMVELITEDRQPAEHPWKGQLVVFTEHSRTLITGVLVDRPAQLMVARWAGCEVLPRVTKKVQALIAANSRDLTGNTAKAREYGIPIVTEPDFLRGIGLPAEAITADEPWARG